MEKKFNWGIIGLGRIAHKFAKGLQRIDGAKVYAVASRSLDKAQAFADDYNAPHAVESYEELLAVEGIDAIYIATPHVLHAENTIMCLEAGIPVLCEKPFAMNSSEVEKMIAASKAHRTFLMEALWTRFLPPMKKTIELVNSGAIGRMHTIKADFGFAAKFDPKGRLFDPALGGGSLLDVGIYPVFLALVLMGEPLSIDAVSILGPTQVDEVCGMLLKFPNDKLALLDSTIRTDTQCEAYLYGTKGHLYLHPRWHELTRLSWYDSEKDETRHFEYDEDTKGLHFEAEEVMRCVQAGQIESTEMSHNFSLMLMRTLDAIRAKAGIHYPADKKEKA